MSKIIGSTTVTPIKMDEYANSLKGNISGDTVRIDDVSPIKHTVKIKARRKNLLNADGMVNGAFVKNNDGSYTLTKISDSTRSSGWVNISIPANTHISLSTTSIEGTAAFAFQFKHKDETYTSAGPLSSAQLAFAPYIIKNEVVSVRVYFDQNVADGASLKISGLQIELGSVTTDYVHYVDLSTISVIVSPDGTSTSATEYIPDADGVVEGVKSLYPSMVVTTDDAGATVEVEYNKDTNAVLGGVETSLDNIIAIQESLIGGDSE